METISSQKIFFLIGATLAFMGVAAGAFGAHALKDKLDSNMIGIFEVAVRYQMYHALALLGVAWGTTIFPTVLVPISGWLMFAGTVIFSGSLYALALSGIQIMGAVTPIGGVFLLAGWLSLIIAAAIKS